MKLFSKTVFAILLVLVVVMYALLLLIPQSTIQETTNTTEQLVAESSSPQTPSLNTFQDSGLIYSYCDELYSEGAPELCTMDYVPVCANDGKTYGNGCSACGADVAYFIDGEC